MRHSLRDPKTGRFMKAWFPLPADGKIKYEVEPLHIEVAQPKTDFWSVVLSSVTTLLKRKKG